MIRGRGQILALVAAALLLVNCSTPAPVKIETAKFSPPKKSDLERVWATATVAIPVRGSTGSMITTNDGSAGSLSLSGASPDTRWPVILLMPGCAAPVSFDLMRALAEQGYVAIAPNSRARYFTPLDCNLQDSATKKAAKTISLRQVEIAYARRKLQNLRWVDPENLFLVGFNDGAAAVARYTGRPFKGRILAEWACGGDISVRGIAEEETSPVFAITSAAVPTHAGDCSQYLRQAGNSQVLALSSKHSQNILLEPIVHTQILQFLDRQLFK